MLGEIKKITDDLQESLQDIGDNYILKTNEEIINVISSFGCGETEFHTVDIERLVKESLFLSKLTQYLRNNNINVDHDRIK